MKNDKETPTIWVEENKYVPKDLVYFIDSQKIDEIRGEKEDKDE